MKKIFLAVCMLFAFKNFIAADVQSLQGARIVVFAIGQAKVDGNGVLVNGGDLVELWKTFQKSAPEKPEIHCAPFKKQFSLPIGCSKAVLEQMIQGGIVQIMYNEEQKPFFVKCSKPGAQGQPYVQEYFNFKSGKEEAAKQAIVGFFGLK